MSTSMASASSQCWPARGDVAQTGPPDFFKFGLGDAFDAKKVLQVLGLKKEDVSRLASVSVKSVRYDDAMPLQVRE